MDCVIDLTFSFNCVPTETCQANETQCYRLWRSQHRGLGGSHENYDFISLPPFLCVMSHLLVTFSHLMKERKFAVMFGEAIPILYPSGHSLILIIGNNKLRQASIRMPRYGKTACTM